ncbi:uncharacterized protein Dwil_GK15939 [Drosophila willistoni]|uniref:Gustatory receptor n=1 Tax=Drosophila willistoni TaxID=7260 RepID=B4MS40_DROWI|nr:putative gustatory receptor 58c [Drosophila willistoni]EDW74929.1 uncharacterized protein Dwil_GK15939 [Drosophila willistoni]
MEQISLSMRFYSMLMNFIGLSNLHYDKRSRQLELRHVPTLVYSLILNVIYFLLAPSAFTLLVQSMYRCEVMGMLPMVFNVVSLAKLSSILLLLLSIWVRRRRLSRLANGYMLLLDNYRMGLTNYCKPRCILKLLMTSSRFYLLMVQLVGPGSAVRCNKTGVTSFSLFYLAAVLFGVMMELLLSLTDFSGYIFVVMANWVLISMAEEVNGMTLDHQKLPQRSGCIRRMAESQLLVGWRKFWQRVQSIDKLMAQLLNISQWQMLFNLFTSYLSDIAIVFRMLIYAEYERDFHLYRLLMYALVCVAHHTDIMMRFHIYEKNHLHWQELLQSLGQLFSDLRPERGELHFFRYVEFAVLRLGRQLQPNSQRVRPKQIAGLFDMSNAKAFTLTSSMAINVLLLFQIAYKNYS